MRWVSAGALAVGFASLQVLTRPAHADPLQFTADRACVLRDSTLSLAGVTARVGDATVTAGQVHRASDGTLTAAEVSVRPCACVPVGLGARDVTASGVDGLRLDHARITLGAWSVPVLPRWWVVWGQRAGLLLPRVEYRDGSVAAGPGVHVPLGGHLAADAWILARQDGAELHTELRGTTGTVRADVRVGGVNAGAARGVMAWNTGSTVVALRADGATSDSAARVLGALPVESLRSVHGVSMGVATGDNAVAAADVEVARRHDDLAGITHVALAMPTVTTGRTVLTARATVGAVRVTGAPVSGDVTAGVTTGGFVGPMDVEGYVRGEAYGTRGPGGDGLTAVGRAGGAVTQALTRSWGGRGARVIHRVALSVGAGAEAGTVAPRVVTEAHVQSALTGPGWRWTVDAVGRADATGGLPGRVEGRTSVAALGLSLAGLLARDGSSTAADATAGWATPRGDRLGVTWAHRERSAWDAVPSWAQPASGPLDLEAVRARQQPGERVAATGSVNVGQVGLRGDAAVDVPTGTLLVAGGAVRLRAACGCAWVEAGGFWVRGGDVVAMLSARFGPP